MLVMPTISLRPASRLHAPASGQPGSGKVVKLGEILG